MLILALLSWNAVLIVTGDSDRIVPSWNAQRLAQAIPGSHLEVIKHCGHLPHEEKVEDFVSVVEKFVQSVFGEPEKQCLEAVTWNMSHILWNFSFKMQISEFELQDLKLVICKSYCS